MFPLARLIKLLLGLLAVAPSQVQLINEAPSVHGNTRAVTFYSKPECFGGKKCNIKTAMTCSYSEMLLSAK